MNRRLYRSPDDRVLAGVAGGMAEAYDVDPSLARVLWALLILLTGGLFLILYVIMAVVVPLRPVGAEFAYAHGPSWGAEPPTGNAPRAGEPAPSPGPSSTSSSADWSAARRQRRENDDNNGPIVLGAILILIGGLFLLRQFVDIDIGRLWPVAVIVVGLVLIVSAFGRGAGHR